MPITLSYPKPRNVISKFFRVARTDNATEKCVIPKGAIIVGVMAYQDTVAVTANSSVNVGWSGAATALLNGLSLTTTGIGHVASGAASGTGFHTPLTADRVILSTYTVGSSTAGGTAVVEIRYFMPGPGELVDS